MYFIREELLTVCKSFALTVARAGAGAEAGPLVGSDFSFTLKWLAPVPQH